MFTLAMNHLIWSRSICVSFLWSTFYMQMCIYCVLYTLSIEQQICDLCPNNGQQSFQFYAVIEHHLNKIIVILDFVTELQHSWNCIQNNVHTAHTCKLQRFMYIPRSLGFSELLIFMFFSIFPMEIYERSICSACDLHFQRHQSSEQYSPFSSAHKDTKMHLFRIFSFYHFRLAWRCVCQFHCSWYCRIGMETK